MELDAYGDDMARFLRMSDEDVERLFRGLTPDGDEDLRDLATFLAETTGSLSGPPRSDVEARHLASLVEAMGPRSVDARRPSLPLATRTGSPARSAERTIPIRHRALRWTAKVVGAAAGLVVLTATLALAGVNLPGTAAETAFGSVGIELPNQNQAAAGAADPAKLPADASDTAVNVVTVINEWFSGAPWSGCEFGARVSHAARGLEGEPDTSHCGAAATAGQGHGQGQGAGASGNAAKGLEKANEASAGAASRGAAHAGAGRDIAEEASSGRMGEAAGANAGS
jgi:hypothetical protein